MGYRKHLRPFCAVLLALCASGCVGKAAKKGSQTGIDSLAARVDTQAVATPVLGDEVEVQEASLRGKDFVPIEELRTVQFDYDRSELGEHARKTLRENAQWLRNNPDIEVKIEGHCDDRGTAEYNLALSQRRAISVRDYYRALGIGSKRMGTIGFGEEIPVCRQATEECWQRNRRGETLVKRG